MGEKTQKAKARGFAGLVSPSFSKPVGGLARRWQEVPTRHFGETNGMACTAMPPFLHIPRHILVVTRRPRSRYAESPLYAVFPNHQSGRDGPA